MGWRPRPASSPSNTIWPGAPSTAPPTASRSRVISSRRRVRAGSWTRFSPSGCGAGDDLSGRDRLATVRPRVKPAFFDQLYADNPDPWEFETSAYEREKYDATIAALEGRRFRTGLELGCSIGVLTEHLKAHVDALLAIDVAEVALERARARNPEVRFERREIPEQYPPGTFDLTVASEVLYYLDPPAFDATLELIHGTLLSVHWRPPTQNYPFGGDDVRRLLTERFGAPAYSRETSKYVLDRWDGCGS